MQISIKFWALIGLLGVVWGLSFLFAKIAVSEVAPADLVFLRVAIAALALWVWVIISRRPISFSKRTLFNWVLMGLIANAIPFFLLFSGQQHIGAGLASILNASTILWTALFAHFILSDEKLNAIKSSGIVVGFLGIIILVGPSALLGIGENPLAQFLVILATLSYGVAAIFSRRFKGSDPLVSAAGQLTFASIWVLPMVFIAGDGLHIPAISTNAILAILAIALLSTAFAYAVFFYVVANVGAVNVVLCTLIVPIIAVLAGKIVLDEVLSFNQYLGMACILSGLVIIDQRLVTKSLGSKLVTKLIGS